MIAIHRHNILSQKVTRAISAILFQLQSHKAILLRWMVIVCVLVAAPIIGVLIVKTDPLLILIALVAPLSLIGLQLLLYRLDFIPLIILISGTATAWYFSKGFTPALILTGLLTGIWLLQTLLLQKRLELIKSPVMAPTLFFILSVSISLIWGKAMADPLLINWPGFDLVQLAQFAVLVLCPAALILTANLTLTKWHLQLLVYTFIGLSTIAILCRFFRLPVELNTRGLISVWAVGLLYGQLLFNKNLSNKYRTAFVVIIGVWLYVNLILGVTWLSGWLPILICLVAITFFKSKKLTLVILVLLILSLVVTYSWWQPILEAEQHESGDSRTAKWEFLFGFDNHSTWGHWLLGTGPFGYARYFVTYFPKDAASTHNNYIDLFLQTGAIGSAIFIWLVGALFQVGYKLRQIINQDMFIAGFVNSALGALVAALFAMMLGDWLTPFVLNQGLHGYSWSVQSWIFLGALAAIPSILNNERKISEISKTLGT